MDVRRGDLVVVDLGRGVGSEAEGRRPALVVSINQTNKSAERRNHNVVTVVPITSSIASIRPYQVLLPADRCQLRNDSKAQSEQIRAVAVRRISKMIGRLPGDLMEQVDEALRIHLRLWPEMLEQPADS